MSDTLDESSSAVRCVRERPTSASGKPPPAVVDQHAGHGHADDDGETDRVPVLISRHNSQHDISFPRMLGYGLGHFYNDLMASMWFTYLVLFLEKVLQIGHHQVGGLLLIGQVTDAMCTPLVGLASDASFLPRCLRGFGRRKAWHIMGTVAVSLSFPFIFNDCLAFAGREPWSKFVWYAAFIMLSQFGWAAVQISHLALIPELSHVDSSRTTMNSLRYAATVLANLTVYVTLALFLRSDHHRDLQPDDLSKFRNANYIFCGVGIMVTLIFYLAIREPDDPAAQRRERSASQTSVLVRMSWKNWFSHAQFYQVAFLYMLSRMYINISSIYMPFYILDTQALPKEMAAILPMIAYLASFLVSTLISLPFINRRLNRKLLYIFGGFMGVINCVIMHFQSLGHGMYGVAVLLGVAQAIILVTSLAITADLINRNTESGAFVYGAMSLLDKGANGIAIFVIEQFSPNEYSLHEYPHECCVIFRPGKPDPAGTPSPIETSFYRNVMVFVPGGCLCLALIIAFLLLPQDIGKREQRQLTAEVDVSDQSGLIDNEQHQVSYEAI